MGAYLSQPITDKEIEVGENETLEFAVAAMQGWRTEMEDAHVCVLDIEKETSLFGVFDGHGGKEVAKFVALHIVEELLSAQSFKTANVSACLKEAYLSLDALIRSETSRTELLQLSACQKTEEEKSLERVIDIDHLPTLLREAITASRFDGDADDGRPNDGDSDVSDFETEDDGSSSDEDDEGRSNRVGSYPIVLSDSSSGSESETEEAPQENAHHEISCPDEGCSQIVDESEAFVPLEPSLVIEDVIREPVQDLHVPRESSAMLIASDSTDSTECRSSEAQGGVAAEVASSVSTDTPTAKVEICSSTDKTEKVSNNCVFDNLGNENQNHNCISNKIVNQETTELNSKQVLSASLGRVAWSAAAVQVCERRSRRTASLMDGLLSLVCPFPCLRSPATLPAEDAVKILSYSPMHSSCSSTPSPLATEVEEKMVMRATSSTPPFETICADETEEPITLANEGAITEEPCETKQEKEDVNGRDVTVAGCTAVVAVIKGETLYVANAGDSRCVLCHDGIALPMSRDHKPTDPDEYMRIKRAGGFVSDGRVNGCLNLSRALGDMEYKKTPNLTPEEYMITANPDIKCMDLQSGDQFIILACDGIWDVLSDQEACDFVLSRLQQKRPLAGIATELCDFCLAEDAEGSGEGCDNMTAMIVLLKDYAVDHGSP